VQRLSDLCVEAGRTERIQKINETFGIDEGARDRAYFRKVIDESQTGWRKTIANAALLGIPTPCMSSKG